MDRLWEADDMGSKRGFHRGRGPAAEKTAARIWAFVLVVLLVLPAAVLAQTPRQTDSQPAEADPADPFRPRLIFLPFLYYTPETKLAVGAGGVLNFRVGDRKGQTRASTVWAFGTYTLAKQFQASVNPQLYFERNNFFLSAHLRYERTPQRFYGVGNDTPSSLVESYTPRIVLVQATLRKRFLGGFYAGLSLDMEKTSLEKVEAGGILETSGLPGSHGGFVSGLGISVDWDTRDNFQFPRKGAFLELAANAYGAASGSDFGFTSLRLEFRRYASPAADQVLALQALLRLTAGDPPFYRLSMLGGDSLIRGYYKGRFRDKDMIAVQAEYRVALGGRFGIVGFSSLGQVFPRFSELELRGFKYSMGVGLRYSLDPRAGTNIRLDLAWGIRSFGLYATARESF